MRDDEIKMLQASFAEVSLARDAAAALFYERLFANDPSLKPMFARTDMRTQGQKLMGALSLVIGSLRKFDSLRPVLSTMAVRHAGYGVRDEHYAVVGKALIETLAQFFGDRFTADLRAAWLGAYAAVSGEMKAAAARAPVRPASGVAALPAGH